MSIEYSEYTTGQLSLCTSEQVNRARRAAARNAEDREELVTFLHMLGVFPGQEHALRTTDRPR